MDATRSSTSSSDRPGLGAALAAALIGAWALLAPSPPPREDASSPALKPYLTAPKGPGEPDAMLVGDSRVFQLDFPAFAEGFGSPKMSGRVWGEGGGTVPDMLGHLRAQGIRPRLLVVGVSPNSTAILTWMRDFRSGAEAEVPLPIRVKRWTRDALLGPFSALPRDRGPELLASALAPRLLAASEACRKAQDAWKDLPPPNTPGYRQLYTESEKVPSEKAVAATIAALREAAASGSRVVLVRLPLGPELLELEEAWGAGAVIDRISRETGAPLVDVHRLPEYRELLPAILDGSHVYGEGPTRLLSRTLGRRVREAGAPGPGGYNAGPVPDP